MLLDASRSQGLPCKLIDFGLAVRCLGFDGLERCVWFADWKPQGNHPAEEAPFVI